MSYVGKTYRIPCEAGGFDNSLNVDIEPVNMVDVLNINYHRDGREKRGGVKKVNSVAISNSPEIMGLCQFRKKNGNVFIVTGTENGRLQKDYSTELKWGLIANSYFNFVTFDDVLYITNGNNIPQTWDGVNDVTSDLSLIPTDWTGTNYPKHMIKHGRGVSERLWAYGCSSNPERIYVSKNNADDFSDAEVTVLNIETGDGYGIVGLAEFGDRVIAFGKNKSYLIDDSSSSVANWGYSDAQWVGGVASEKLVIRTPNDIICMTADGDIYSVRSVESYGDYKAASLARPTHIDRWIRDNIDLTQTDKFWAVYDSTFRAIRIFMVRLNRIQVDVCLMFFIDRGVKDGWTKHLFASDLMASGAEIEAANVKKIYTGGDDGYVFELEASEANDNGDAYYGGFTTAYSGFDNTRYNKKYGGAWYTIIPQGTEELNINCNIDGYPLAEGTFLVDENGVNIGDEAGNRIVGDTFKHWAISATGGTHENLSHQIEGMGKRIQLEVYNDVLNEDFFISDILMDFMPLGNEPS